MHQAVWPVRLIGAVLGLSASGYCVWRGRSESPRAAANRALLGDIRLIHAESSGTQGSPRVHASCVVTDVGSGARGSSG
jgi:hypothetical protein